MIGKTRPTASWLGASTPSISRPLPGARAKDVGSAGSRWRSECTTSCASWNQRSRPRRLISPTLPRTKSACAGTLPYTPVAPLMDSLWEGVDSRQPTVDSSRAPGSGLASPARTSSCRLSTVDCRLSSNAPCRPRHHGVGGAEAAERLAERQRLEVGVDPAAGVRHPGGVQVILGVRHLLDVGLVE